MVKGRRVLTKVFLDSSVVFTAVNSPIGGSAKLFTLKSVKLTVSRLVLAEVEKNVRKKLFSYHLERFFMLVDKLVILDQFPDDDLIKKAEKVIVKKDAVILAEAKQAKVEYLVTLDRKHFLKAEVEKFLWPKRVVTPKMFFETYKN
jgi:predicted nucleic acid-binding protein